MGFGFLLFGYALYLNTIVPVYTIPVSGIVMALGLRKLKIWNSGFRGAAYANLVVTAVGLIAAGFGVAAVAGAGVPDVLSSALSAGLSLLVMLFHFYLGSGMISLAKEVGLPSLQGRAFFFRTAACIYWLLYAFLNLDLGGKLDPVLARLFVPMVVVGFVVAVIGFAVLFSFYTDVGLPDENDAPEKPGFFARMKQRNEEENRKDD
ncbi:MAG: hypothetical protein J5958_05260 [Clostridia bacterium]|nr:hypothetical protein [Clostridia bacterium]